MKAEHFVNTVTDFLTDTKSYILMLSALLLTSDTAVLFSMFVSMLFLDYITGILAYNVEFKNSGEKAEVYVTKSKRLRESFGKVAGYFIIITFSWFISSFIYTDNISLFGVLKSFNVLQLSLLICGGIEFFSNLENSKRMGFDVLGKIENGAKRVWKVINSVKGVGIISGSLLMTSCMSVKKAEKVMRDNPDKLAELCADCFPVKPIEIIKGDTVVRVDSVLSIDSVRVQVQGDCPDGTILKLDCPPTKTITRIVNTHSTDTVKVVDTAKETVLVNKIKSLEKWKDWGLIGWFFFGLLFLFNVLRRRN